MKKLNTFFIGALLLIAFSSMELNAQQEPQFTQFWNAKNYFNPATSGLNYKHQANLLARWQWLGVNGAPDTQLASYSLKLNKIHGGIGVNYMHNKIGFSETNKVKLGYAYHLEFKNEGILSLGIAGGIQHMKYSPSWVPPTTSGDSSLPSAFSDAQFTSDFGIAYAKNRFNVGMSVTQLNEARYSGNNSTYQDARHYFLFADYTFGKEEGFQFVPQLFLRSDLNFASIDMNVLLKYKSMYYIGLTIRSRDAIGFIGGVDIKRKYRISYSYDLTVSKLNNGISNGSHEIVLGLRLK